VQILGGVMAGETTGAPIAMLVENADHVKWKGKAIEPMTAPRPGHADLTGAVKYGYKDCVPPSNAPLPAKRPCALQRRGLQTFPRPVWGIIVGGYVASIGEVAGGPFGDMPYEERFQRALKSRMCAAQTQSSAQKMRDEIEKTIHGKNTLGGVLEIVALNLPVGTWEFHRNGTNASKPNLRWQSCLCRPSKAWKLAMLSKTPNGPGRRHTTRSTFNIRSRTFDVQPIVQEGLKAGFQTDNRSSSAPQ
jgi:chorismate synthase